VGQYPSKILSVFEPQTEIIRKGKASKPNEFGHLVKVQEAENQIVTHYEVFAERPEDYQWLVPAVEQHQRRFGRPPRMVAADAGLCSQKNERTDSDGSVLESSRTTSFRSAAVSPCKHKGTLFPPRCKCAVGRDRTHNQE